REINKENKKKGRWFGPEPNCSEKPAGSAIQASKESCFGGAQKSLEKQQGGVSAVKQLSQAFQSFQIRDLEAQQRQSKAGFYGAGEGCMSVLRPH
ncbi:hypothetical protein E2320_006873, partial [Naja naja]